MEGSEFKIIYIAGNGHSGSTLLDIILGSNKNIFSAGELTFITRDSIFDEYCSCRQMIRDCRIWTEILKIWNEKREISYHRYKMLNRNFEGNRKTLNLLFHRLFSTTAYKDYSKATLDLFKAIHQATGASIIIDSSKTNSRIPILNSVAEIRVLHICRDFTGVLNSSKKSSKKNIAAGIEKDNPPRKTLQQQTIIYQ